MTDRPTASTITDAQLDHLLDELTALRTVARGYCPACGRGDAAPTVADWERERQRADTAEARLQHLQASSEAAGILLTRTTDERDQLAGVLRDVLAAFSTTVRDQAGGRILGYYAEAPVHPDDMARWRAALDQSDPA